MIAIVLTPDRIRSALAGFQAGPLQSAPLCSGHGRQWPCWCWHCWHFPYESPSWRRFGRSMLRPSRMNMVELLRIF